MHEGKAEGCSASPNLVGIQAVVGWCDLLMGQSRKRSCGIWLEVTASDWGGLHIVKMAYHSR